MSKTFPRNKRLVALTYLPLASYSVNISRINVEAVYKLVMSYCRAAPNRLTRKLLLVPSPQFMFKLKILSRFWSDYRRGLDW
jgi:hypothetical protein